MIVTPLLYNYNPSPALCYSCAPPYLSILSQQNKDDIVASNKDKALRAYLCEGIQGKMTTPDDKNTADSKMDNGSLPEDLDDIVPEHEQATYERLYNLLMQAPAAISLLRGPQHIYELTNARYLQLIGHRDIIGKPFREARPELAGQGMFELLDTVYATGEPFIGNEIKAALDRLGNGKLDVGYFNFVYQPTCNIKGEVDGIFIHAVEVTEQIKARQKIQESEVRLRRLVDSNIIGVSFTSINGAILDTNDNFLHMIGYTREEVASGTLNWTTMTAPEYVELDRAALQEIQRNGAVSSPYEKEYIDKYGNRIPVLVGGALIDAAQGEIVTFIIDIRKQKQMEEEIRRAKEQLEAIFHNVADGITVQDKQGSIIYANDVVAILCGFPSAEAMLNTPPEIMRQAFNRFSVQDEMGRPLPHEEFPGSRTFREGKSVQAIIQFSDAHNESRHWSLIKSQPIFDDNGQIHLVVNVMTDISDQQEIEQRKNEFISMASHELKTPVTALKGFTNILQRRLISQHDEQTLRYLARMDAQLNKLTKLINDLLDISKIQSGKLTFQAEQIDLTALVHELVNTIQGTTSTHQLSVEGETHIQISGDKDRLEQVLINLLTNAIKYSPHANKVVVHMKADGQHATIGVQDFGIGIAGTHHEKIFERFYQVTDPEEKTYPGLGIGLYISNQIIKQHQGHMWVESAKGHGATFWFTIPLAQIAQKV
jgi:PAS domain S-box-containing protein